MNISVLALACGMLCNDNGIAQTKLFSLLPSKQTGVNFRNDIVETEGLNVLAYEYFFNGGGLAVADFDNDGLQDLFFTANMGANKLYRNLGSLKFKDMTQSSGPGIEGRPGHWKTGVAVADVNADGKPDIYVCYSGKGDPDVRRNQLFINEGGFRFREAAKEFGLDDPSFSNQAAFFDYDRDGDLDMFLLNHSTKKVDNLEFTKYRDIPDEFAGCRFYENEGGRFRDVSDRVGISRSSLTFGLGVVVADIDLDGWPDLYVTNDYNEPDHLYLNNRDKTFRDVADSALSHMSQFSMGSDIADFNNDGLPDIISLDMLPEDNRRQKLLQLQENYEIFELMQQQGLHRQYMRNMLHLNNGDGTFSEIGQLAGVSNTDWSWTPVFADLDNDGHKDLFITNGYLRDYTNKDFLKYWGDYKVKKAVEREPVQLMDLVKAMPSTKIPNYVFQNHGDLTFSNRQKEWGLDRPAISSAAVCVDLDNDGDLDIVVNNINEEAFVFRNDLDGSRSASHLTFKILAKDRSTASQAKVRLYQKGRMQYVETGSSRGYLSSASYLAHFGLGGSSDVDSVSITWPDGASATIPNPSTGKLHEIPYPQAPLFDTPVRKTGAGLLKKSDSPIDYVHQGFGENDFKRQQLMLFMLSNTGPVMAKSDVDRDGREDVFVSGGKHRRGQVWMQSAYGTFSPMPGLEIVNEEESAVSAAVFFDANGDGWPDLYVAKGGYSVWEPNTASLQDELYLNDGKGVLVPSVKTLPDVSSSAKSCVRPIDIDGDGDLDLFVGGRVIPGRYPMTPESFLLINDGKGRFTRKRDAFSYAGMVTDARWHDVNGDGRPDLFLVGEMMPISVFLNTPDGFEDASERYLPERRSGFWSALLLTDVDGDGKEDLMAANLGRNTPFRVSPEEPAELFYADFDDNGSVDPFFCYHIQGRSYPYVSRDELNDQIYAMRKRFTSYEQYSNATLKEVFTPEELKKAVSIKADEQETVLLLQRNGAFKEKAPLPIQAQFTAVRQVLSGDFDRDGKTDLMLFGNQSQNRLKMGAISASRGCLLLGRGDGTFEYAEQNRSGLAVVGDVKSAITLKHGARERILIGATDRPLQCYDY